MSASSVLLPTEPSLRFDRASRGKCGSRNSISAQGRFAGWTVAGASASIARRDGAGRAGRGGGGSAAAAGSGWRIIGRGGGRGAGRGCWMRWGASARTGERDGGSVAEADAIGAICSSRASGRCGRGSRSARRTALVGSRSVWSVGLMSGLMSGLTSTSGCGAVDRRELGCGGGGTIGSGGCGAMGKGERRMHADPSARLGYANAHRSGSQSVVANHSSDGYTCITRGSIRVRGRCRNS